MARHTLDLYRFTEPQRGHDPPSSSSRPSPYGEPVNDDTPAPADGISGAEVTDILGVVSEFYESRVVAKESCLIRWSTQG